MFTFVYIVVIGLCNLKRLDSGASMFGFSSYLVDSVGKRLRERELEARLFSLPFLTRVKVACTLLGCRLRPPGVHSTTCTYRPPRQRIKICCPSGDLLQIYVFR
jgi:hypothetical protein